MADEYEIFEFLEYDHAEAITMRRRRRTETRKKKDPFNLNAIEFNKRYILSKELTRKLCDELRPFYNEPLRSTDLSLETKVLIALSFYATGAYQRLTGDSEGHFVVQTTVSKIITRITASLNTLQMRQKYIKFPATDEERKRIKIGFHKKFGIPGVLGCIDCTHIAIIRPTSHEEWYRHKQWHSLNVQLICDADMQIMSVDTSHGGAVHDSSIWATHPLRSHLEDLSRKENAWFLGDSEYPLTTTMMTPICDAAPDSPEEHYTKLHGRATQAMKRTIQLFKARFGCLRPEKILHYSPEKAGLIVSACVLLHNISNSANIPEQKLSYIDVIRETQLQIGNAIETPRTKNIALEQGIATRNALIGHLWEKRYLRFHTEESETE